MAATIAVRPAASSSLPFSYRKAITIDHTKVGNSGAPTTLANYPMLYSVTDPDLRTVANGGDVTDTAGDDIIFRALTVATCNDPVNVCTLDHEIESYDPATGKLVAWVNIPVLNTISASSDTVIYIYYGNSSITTSTQVPTGVWDTNYKGVWHLKEATGVTNADSTVNANNGTPTNGPTTTSGKINGALNLDGANDVILVNDAASLDMSTAFTLSAWIKPDSTINVYSPFNQGLMDKGVFGLFFDKSDGKLHFTASSTAAPAWATSYNGAQEYIIGHAVYNGKLYVGQAVSTGDGDILVFDGTNWKYPGGTGANTCDSGCYDGAQEDIHSLAVYNGKLYAGQGQGTGDGDVLVFDGTSWTTSYDGGQELIYSLAVYNGKLYAGQGTGAGDGDVLVFDGTSWTTSYNGAEDAIDQLVVYNGKLYAGQGFSTGDGDVLVFDGTSWTTSYNGAAEYIRSLGVYNGKLYAGQGNGAGDGDVLVFDGTSWTTSYNGAQEEIHNLTVYNGKLYAAQGYTTGDGDVLVFDGTSWTTSHNGAQEYITALVVYNGKLYGGQGQGTGDGDVLVFDDGKSATSTTSSWTADWQHVTASYDGSTMSLYVAGALDNSQAITFTPNTNALGVLLGTTYGSQMAGGSPEAFDGILDEIRISDMARSEHWIKTEYINMDRPCVIGNLVWNAVGSTAALGAAVKAVAVYNGEIYIGGSFTDAAGDTNADLIAKWNGSAWSAVGSTAGETGDVRALGVYNGELYVGGSFTSFGGATGADNIAKWNGSAWSAVGAAAPTASVQSLAVYNGELYIGGWFNAVGGNGNIRKIAKWNGSAISRVGSFAFLNNTVIALAVYKGELYMAGQLFDAGGDPNADYIAKWNGSALSAVGSAAVLNTDVNALAVYNDELYVGGNFTIALGAVADRIAKWNGSAWSDVGGVALTSGGVFALGVYNGQLHVGGSFTNVAGDTSIDYLARWNGSAWSDVGSNDMTSTVRALAVYNGELYAGGDFTNLGTPPNANADYIATWRAESFCTVGTEDDDPPSAVKLRGARAVSYEGAYAQTVQLKWRTSHEIDHLGFHVYREQGGQLLRVTPSIVAGSALLARGRTQLTAGQRYSWWDVLPMDSGPLQYWLEEIDLHGLRTWHGPIAVTSAKGHRDLAKPEQVRSVLLGKLGRSKHKGRLPGAPWQGAADAAIQTSTAAQLAVQGQLAAGSAIKLGISAEGWYRVDQPTLIAAGLDPKVDPRRLRLYADGLEVPMVVTGAKDKRLQPQDAIEFYGVGLETPWTDTRTYWLVAGNQAGQRMGTSAWQGRTKSGPVSFPYTVTWQPRELYFAALRNGEADNLFGPVVSTWPTEQAFTLNHLDPAPPGAARLEVTLQGVTEGPHAVDVQVNGTSVGTVTFDGQGLGRANLSVPSSQLQAGANLVTLIALGGELDVSLVATVRLTYWHTYTAEEDVLRGSVPAGQHVTIGGFSTRPISVVDVTEPDAVRAVPGQVKRQGSTFAVTVVGPGPGTRTLLAFTDRVAAMPAKIYANQPSQWHSASHRADLVMIGHPAFLPSLATLKAWREQQGWRVALIDVEDLYDEFTFGAKSPWALRAFMQTARTNWAQPPRFLLLGGDASFDPRDTQGMGETDFVPTKLIDTNMMETASDDWFGDLNDDGVAEVPVGRLAVRTAEEANTVVQKLIGYDQTAASRTAVLVADTPDSLDFGGTSTRLAEVLPSGMATQAIYRSQSDDATTRGTLLAAFNSGAWLVNYMGHGSVEVWRGEVFTSLDASTLTNGLRLPFVSTMTCLNGFFHDVWSESLAEALQRAPQGGAVAVWASSSLSQAAEQVSMNRKLLQGLSAGLTLGDAVAQAKAVAQDQNVRRSWILFGDPTTRLK